MANERLRRAIQQAGLRLEDVAEHVEIDVKTAERWITKGRLPHARNRVADRAAAAASTSSTCGRSSPRSDRPRRATASWCGSTRIAARFRTSGGTSCSRRRRERLDVLVLRGAVPAGRPIGSRRRWSGGRPRRASRCGCCTAIPTARRSRCGVPRRASATGWPRGSGWRWRTCARRSRSPASPCGCTARRSTTRSTATTTSCWSTRTRTASRPAKSPVLHLRRFAGGRLFDHYMASFERVWEAARPLAEAPADRGRRP